VIALGAVSKSLAPRCGWADFDVMVAEHDLTGPLLDLVTAAVRSDTELPGGRPPLGCRR